MSVEAELGQVELYVMMESFEFYFILKFSVSFKEVISNN